MDTGTVLFKEVDIAQGLTAAAANIINEYQATSLVSRVPPFFQPVKNYHKLQLTIKIHSVYKWPKSMKRFYF